MNRQIPDDFIPVEICQGERVTVRWRPARQLDLESPFFDTDVARMPSQGPERTTDLRTLLQIGAQASEGGAPAGIIAHVSRCGSTLVANGLRALDLGPVLSEPQPICFCLGALGPASRTAAIAGLGAIMTLWSARLAHGGPVVLKLPSWALNDLDLLLEAWPQSPWVLCLRDPGAVLSSIRRREPDWAEILRRPPCKPRLGFPSDVLSEAGVQWERVVEMLFRGAGAASVPPSAIVDYRDLGPDTVLALAGAFYGPSRLPLDASRRIAQQFQLDAKSATPTVFVRPDLAEPKPDQDLAAALSLYRKLAKPAPVSA